MLRAVDLGQSRVADARRDLQLHGRPQVTDHDVVVVLACEEDEPFALQLVLQEREERLGLREGVLDLENRRSNTSPRRISSSMSSTCGSSAWSAKPWRSSGSPVHAPKCRSEIAGDFTVHRHARGPSNRRSCRWPPMRYATSVSGRAMSGWCNAEAVFDDYRS